MKLLTLASLGLASLLVSCGYSSSLRLPEDFESVGVEVFANDSPLPVLERALYSSLDANLARMVSAPLVAPSGADLVVRGRIVDYFRMAAVLGSQGELQGSGITLDVQAWLVDRRTGERVGTEQVARRRVVYAIGVGTAESGALELALETLSQGLILDLFSQRNYDSKEEEQELPPSLRPEDEL